MCDNLRGTPGALLVGARLNDDELRALGTLADEIDPRRVHLHRGGGGVGRRLLRHAMLAVSRGRALALGNHVFLPDWCRASIPVLAHELTHCAQYQAWGPLRYYARAIADRVREVSHRLGGAPSPYEYRADPAQAFARYGMEQQAQIVEDCFRGDADARALSPYRPPVSATARRMSAANASTSASEVS